MKLNLGSGKDYREGYVNVDAHEKFNPDVLMDMKELDYPENTVTEIVMQDVIDHITFIEAKIMLRNCYKWLGNNGIINIRSPNLEVIALLAAKGNYEALKWLYGTDGQGSTSYRTNIIRWCYSITSLTEILEELGFIIIEKHLENMEYSIRVIGVKRE